MRVRSPASANIRAEIAKLKAMLIARGLRAAADAPGVAHTAVLSDEG